LPRCRRRSACSAAARTCVGCRTTRAKPVLVRIAATPDGVHAFDGTRWMHHALGEPPASRGVFTILEDRAGRGWCGGHGGLWLLEDGGLRRAGPAYDVRRVVYSLLEDRAGRLWIGTDMGLRRSDGETLVDPSWMAASAGHEANRAAVLAADDGSVWLGSTLAVTRFEQDFDGSSPPLTVRGFRTLAAGVERPLEGRVHGVQGRGSMGFVVGVDSLRTERRIECRHRPAGEHAWSESVGGTRYELELHDPTPGQHVLEVQARTLGGDWGPTWRSPVLEVHLPVFQRWWVLALLAVASGALTVLVARYLTQRRRANLLLREVVARRREVEASLQELARTDRLRSLGFLAGGLAHDLRNVLTVLTGSLSLQRDQIGAEPDVGHQLEAIEAALERATQLSAQLQTFATGGAPVKDPVALPAVVEECARLVLSGSSVRFESDLPAELPAVEADEGQLRQVVENLLLNARQAQSERGWIRVTGRHEPDRDPATVVLTVANGGPGIPAALQRHVFDPFFTTEQSGSGLGLSTARSIVERHGGTLRVQASRPGRTALVVALPVARVAKRTPAAEAPPALPSRAARVLVVDDEDAVRGTLTRLLERLGHEAVPADGSEAAIRAVTKGLWAGRPVRLAIVDLTLPDDLAGAEILPQLRRLAPELRALASSGYAADLALAEPEAYGFDGMLRKPYQLADLERALPALLEARGPAPVAPPAPSRK